MRTFLRFLKPYRGLCLLTLLVMALDVAGALYLPTIVADMINIGVAGGDLDFILRKGGLMLGVALVSGGGTLMGCFLCARLSARIGRDMRNALYDKSLTFSASDFEGFGTGSMITRTLNDVNVVQQAFVWSVQMVLPVPLMCVIGVLMAFSIDHVMGLLLIGITLVVILGAVLVTRRASAIFARAQRFLDRISVVVRENITGARVIRAFNKATGEAGRMRRSFTDYAQAAIQANTLFFVLESLAIFFLNLCVVAILWLGGNRIGGGFMEIGDITALTEYAVLAAGPGHSLLACWPRTGRTHQIRVHMSYIGHPLAGDTLYGGSDILLRRHALHCGILAFAHPLTGEPLRVECPLPEDMAALARQEKLLMGWQLHSLPCGADPT